MTKPWAGLLAVLVLCTLGFLAMLVRLDGLFHAVDALGAAVGPSTVTLERGQSPLEITMEQQCVTLTKVVEGITIEYPCCRLPDEGIGEWGERCQREFAEFCAGFGG